MAKQDFTDQVTLARIEPGMWIYTSVEPYSGVVELPNPDYKAGIARRVKQVERDKDGRRLVFEGGSGTASRNGTTLVYRFHLDAGGKPVPVPTYPACKTCGATERDPACKTKAGAMSPTWHANRAKAPAPSQISKHTAKVPVTLHASDAQGDAALEGEVDDSVLSQIPCPQCKGYGLVRKRGKRAGEKYKTLNGAMAADANGNAATCPMCKGAALVAA